MITPEEIYLKNISRPEIYRYLGFRGTSPDDNTRKLVKRALDEISRLSRPGYVYMSYPLTTEDDLISFNGISIPSKDLLKTLKGCSDILLLAATLGSDLDAAIRKYQYSDTAYALILHATGAAAIESYLDSICQSLEKSVFKESTFRPRFSPGYGDLDISWNQNIINLTNATKHIGLFTTDTHLLSPAISVTAYIGLKTPEVK